MKLAIFGYGGHAREVASLIDKDIVFFVDDKYANEVAKPLSTFDPFEYKIIIAIGDSNERENIVNKLPNNTTYFSFIHPTAIITSTDFELGEGSFIGPYSIITTNVKIGKHSILNRGNHIGHDTIIGDYFSAMPGAIISGNVQIGNRVYFGTNSSAIEKLKICNDVIIGANGVVVKNIDKNGTYVGVPVKKLNYVIEK